jgi:hypothetical protein
MDPRHGQSDRMQEAVNLLDIAPGNDGDGAVQGFRQPGGRLAGSGGKAHIGRMGRQFNQRPIKIKK